MCQNLILSEVLIEKLLCPGPSFWLGNPIVTKSGYYWIQIKSNSFSNWTVFSKNILSNSSNFSQTFNKQDPSGSWGSSPKCWRRFIMIRTLMIATVTTMLPKQKKSFSLFTVDFSFIVFPQRLSLLMFTIPLCVHERYMTILESS